MLLSRFLLAAGIGARYSHMSGHSVGVRARLQVVKLRCQYTACGSARGQRSWTAILKSLRLYAL